MKPPDKYFYQRLNYRKVRVGGNSFKTFVGGVSFVVVLLVLSAIGIWESFKEEPPQIKNIFNLKPNNPNIPPVTIPDVTPPKVPSEINFSTQQNQFLQPGLADKAQVQLLAVQRISGKRDEVEVQLRIYRIAEKVEATDAIDLGATTARNSITSETYNAIDPAKRSSGKISLTNIRIGQPMDAYVVLKVPETAIVIDIFAQNTSRFKNVPIGDPELGIAGLNNLNNSSLIANKLTPGLPTASLPNATTTPSTNVPLPPTLGGTSILPEITVPSKNPNQFANNSSPSSSPPSLYFPSLGDLVAGSSSPSPVPVPSTPPTIVGKGATPTPTTSPSGVQAQTKTSSVIPVPLSPPPGEVTPSPQISILEKAAPNLQEHRIDTLEENKNRGFKPGEFAQLAHGSKVKVELISVERIEDTKSGNPDIVGIQMRISRLGENAVANELIKLDDTTARNSVSNQTYKVLDSIDRITQPVPLKDIPQDGSVDTYVWLKVPKGVYSIDILVPETGPFKNVPISK